MIFKNQYLTEFDPNGKYTESFLDKHDVTSSERERFFNMKRFYLNGEESGQKGNVKLAVIYIGLKSKEGYKIAQSIANENKLNDEKALFYTSESMSELGNIFSQVYSDITNMN